MLLLAISLSSKIVEQHNSGIRQFADVFFIYVQQGDKHYVDRADAHQLKYVLKGEMTIDDGRQQLKVHNGECVFVRRDHRVKIRKYPLDKEDFQCITLIFRRDFLRTYYRELAHPVIDVSMPRFDDSVILLPKLPQVESLFLSMMPYTETDVTPSEALMNLKLREGVLTLLGADDRFYPTLFDFAEAWKIDILDFLDSNYMYEFTLAELANYTGRSLATFKRDFAKVSSLSPEKWLLKRRLEAAYDLLSLPNGISVTDAASKVGFKNRSHFTKTFKEHFGKSPSEVRHNKVTTKNNK